MAAVLAEFTVRPRRHSRLSVRVTILRSQYDLQRLSKRLGCRRFRRIWALSNTVYVRQRGRLLPECVRLYFHAETGGLSANTVTHECFHAACSILARSGHEVVTSELRHCNTRIRRAGTPDTIEEQGATIAGNLASRIYRVAYARGIIAR